MSQTDRAFFVNIMSNRSRTLSIGMTNNLARRIYEHRHPTDASFTARYHVTRLVYVETFPNVLDAIAYEKRLRGWARARKLELIGASNPECGISLRSGWGQPCSLKQAACGRK